MSIKLDKRIVLTLVAIGGCIGSAIASGVTTYRCHDKIKKCIEEDAGIVGTIKEVGKDYMPAVGAVIGTVGTIAANQIIGEYETKKLKKTITDVKKKCDDVKNMYVDQNKAVKASTDEETQKKIEETVQHYEDMREFTSDEHETLTFYDPITKIFIKSSKSNFDHAVYSLNKSLTLNGYFGYNEFYAYFGIDLEEEAPDYADWGWCYDVAEEYGTEPWVDISFISKKDSKHGDYYEILYKSYSYTGYEVYFEPSDEYKEYCEIEKIES